MVTNPETRVEKKQLPRGIVITRVNQAISEHGNRFQRFAREPAGDHCAL